MVAPGRICSRQTTEVNFPDIVENSYTQQEETKLSFRDSKNRLLLSQVAYFQNYQLKTDKDQKDHDEEQKYRDSKNKLLMSQVAYYLACRLKLKFCGFLCSAPAPGRPPLRKISAVNIPEGIEKSCSQQEEKKPNVRASKNRLLSQVAYFQNYRMKTYKDQKDQEEEQNYRDSKNKLFMSQVAYYLACRLKMKVPGLLRSAPNVIMVASGKPFSKKFPEVNVPEGTEKSCSQQEDKKLDFGVSKNRCLMNEVNYSLNYQLKMYEDRKDHDEEQKYGDSKNKLVMSQVVCYLGCQLKMEVPEFLCSAPNVIMVVASGMPFSGMIPEVNVPEGIEKFCSQQEDNKLDVRVSKNRCLMSEVNYSLNYQLKMFEDRKDHDEEQKYGDSKNKLVMSQVVYYLGCQLKTEVPGFLCSAPNVICPNGRLFTRKMPEVNVPQGIEKFCFQQDDNNLDVRVSKNKCLMSEVNYSLNYQLKMFEDQKDYDEEQKYRDSKNKLVMSQVVCYLACQLTTEVPGFLCSAPNVICPNGRLFTRKMPEVNVPQGIEKFCFQQDDNKLDFGVSKNRCLMSEVNYSLNYQLKMFEDRKDHDEEQKYGDSENKLVMSQVVCYLACQLKMEVPGFLCSAPNVIMVASGKLLTGKIPEVNIPEGIEKSCFQQEDNKLDVRFSKNRCLMSEVNYSLNYQLKIFEDRKDHDEEQKYGDSENKLVMSQVVYYLACQLMTEVPGFLCSASNVIMVASGKLLTGKIPEVNVPEGIEKSCFQQEDNKLDVRFSKNRCLMSEVNYSLNYQLKIFEDRKDHNEKQKYEDSENKLVMSQVVCYLACQLKTEVPGFLCSAPNVIMVASGRFFSGKIPEVNIPEGIEKSCSQQEDNISDVRINENRCLMSEVNYSLNYQLKTYEDRKDHNEEQKYGDSKNKLLMSQAAYYYLGCRLKMEEVNIPEGMETFCSQQEKNNPNGRASKNRLLLSQVAYFQNYQMKTYEDQKDHNEEQKYGDRKNKLLMSQVAYYLSCRRKTEVPGFLCSAPNVIMVASGRPLSGKISEVNISEGIEKFCSQQEDNKPNVGVSKNRCLMSEVNYSLNYQLKTYNDQKDHDEEQKYGDSKNKLYRSQAAYYLGCRLKVEESQGDDEEEEEKGPVSPRNLQESVEAEAPQESWDEGDLTLSVPPGTSAFNETYRSNLHSLEEQHVNLAVDTDSEYAIVKRVKMTKKKKQTKAHHAPGNSEQLLSMELVEAEEPEVFRYSLDLLYSTHTAYPEFYYTCQAYTYVIFVFVEERVRLTLDMDSRFLTMTVIRLPLVSWAEKVPFVSHRDCNTRTVPPFVHHHDCGTRTVPPFVYHRDRDTRTVPPFVYHRDRGTRTVPPFVYHRDRGTRTVPPFVYHRDRGTRTVPPFVYHRDRGTRTVPPFVYHRDRGTRTVPPFVYHRDRDTRTVPPFVYHRDRDTRTVPPFVYHRDRDTRTVPPFVYHRDRDTRTVSPFVYHRDRDIRTVSPFVYHHDRGTRIVPPFVHCQDRDTGLFQHLSTTMILVPELFHHFSITMIVIQQLFHHLSTTMIVVPGLFHHLSVTMIVILGRFHHLSITVIMVPGLFHHFSVTMIVIPGPFHHFSTTMIVVPGLFHHFSVKIIMVPELFHHLSVSMIVIPGLFHHLSVTMIVIPGLFHHLSITIIVMTDLYLSETPYLY
ncbi:hypothetical protein P7K49_037209 [Saguinus oedipus]|uniref:Olduvai domain-containing protein n=1 Tax=Saguinus oedipus TaxID=9490 RepID=A0ABQ9THF8_SAGOE|nr:hypothetical protein P7K49_037209 [Saguinus oedipus]